MQSKTSKKKKKIKENALNESFKAAKDSLENYIQKYFFSLKEQRAILHIGPTNSGKTYHAIQALKDCGSGCYLSPLRLLACEVYDTLNEQGIVTSLKTGEEQIIIPTSTVLSATVEMCPQERMDVMVIDECSMLADDSRGEKWFNAIMQNNAKTVHLIGNPESEALITSVLKLKGIPYDINRYERLVPLQMSVNDYGLNTLPKNSIIVVFSRIEALSLKNYMEHKGRKCSVVYGALPPEVKKEQMRLFMKGENDIAVCTDAIGMGLNMPCETIYFHKLQKFDGTNVRELNHFEMSQISGRAGRYLQFDVGYVCAATKEMTATLKKNINKRGDDFKKTYFGLTYDILERIPVKSVREKLENFKKMDLIPEQYKNLLVSQPPDKYLENYHPSLEQMELRTAFAFISSPVNDLNRNYYHRMLMEFTETKRIRQPKGNYGYENLLEMEIYDQNGLKINEIAVAEIDLYMSMSNNNILKHYIDIGHELKGVLAGLTKKINEYLVKRKTEKLKLCNDCGTIMSVNSKFKTCHDCYQNSKPDYW